MSQKRKKTAKKVVEPPPLPECKGGRLVASIQEDHRRPVYGVAFWPGEDDAAFHHLASCGANRCSIYAVRAADGDDDSAVELRQLYVDNDEDESFFCCAWSRRGDAPLLAVCGQRGIAKIVDCADGRLDCALVGHGNAINDCCFHPVDAALLLTASKDESVRLWNSRTCVCVAVFAGDRGHRDEVLSVDCHPTGAACCSAGMDNTIKVWQLDAAAVADAARRSHDEPQPANHKPFATVFEQFPAFSSAAVHSNYVDCARWAGSLVLSKSTACSLALWTPDPGAKDRSPLAANAAAPPPPSKHEASEDVLVVRELELPDADIWFMRFGLDSKRRLVAAGNKAARVYVYDVDDGTLLADLGHTTPKSRAAVRQVAFAPGSQWIACCGDDSAVYVYKLDGSSPV